MSKIIQFPKVAAARAGAMEMPKSNKSHEGLGFFGGVRLGVWMLAVLMWPLLRWIAALDVVWQFCRMAYHWDTPAVYAGWQFLAHFAALAALHYYVGIYRPRGAPDAVSKKFSR